MSPSNDEYLAAERLKIGCHHGEHPSCSRFNIELRRRVAANGTVTVGFQCRDCGRWHAVRKAAVTGVNDLPEYEPELWRRFWQEQADSNRAQYEAEERAKATEWWRRYTVYLATDRWRKKSAMVIARDVTCQACLVRPATQAHHLTYEHVGDEPLFDLKGVCQPCHEKITRLDRERRATRATPLDKEPL